MIKPIGHFRVWRELFTKPIWLNSTLEQQTILITLIAMANFNEKEWEWKGQKFEVQPGQFITSLESIRLNTGGKVSIQNIRTALNRFEKLGFLTNESTKTGRLITLVNWEDYQYVEGKTNKDTNIDLTKDSQTPNKDLTPREEGKKDKEGNNISFCQEDEVEKEPELKFPVDSMEYKLADFLRRWIVKNNPKAKVPDNIKMDNWSQSIDYMLRLDKRDPEDIRTVIEFCQKDSFWMTNILSTAKLRKQFDQLYLKSQQKTKQHQVPKHKTKFHLGDSRGNNYTAKELEEKLLSKQRGG